MKLSVATLLSSVLFLTSCNQGNAQVWVASLPVAKDTVLYTTLGQSINGSLLIKDTIDLKDKACHIPKGVTLVFDGGLIKNGTLIGEMTKLKSCKPCFNRIRIQGTWNVATIKSTWFIDLTYDNALKDVIALSNSSVKNKIIIEKGNYQVSSLSNNDACLSINSNTELVLDGTVRLAPNSFKCYNIVKLEGENIKIHGNGLIIGDKRMHASKDGEWGMGINIHNAHHVTVTGLTIKDCWGDCIYVGSYSTEVTIENCKLDHGRRQGISITSANGVVIRNCEITNVSGTSPEFAIDVEPNKNDRVDKVLIENVVANNCVGGIMAVCYAPNSSVGSVIVRNCIFSSVGQYALSFVNCEFALAQRNTLIRTDKKEVLMCKGVGNLVIKRNSLHYGSSVVEKMRSTAKRVIMGEKSEVIRIIECDNSIIQSNTEYK